MSNADLPASVDAYRIFEHGSERQGTMQVSRFSRLAPMLASSDGEVDVVLAFTFDSEKRRIVSGKIAADVRVQCQRCLEPMSLTLASEFRIGVVESEAVARQLPTDLEPIILEGSELDVLALVEDELIMALPDFPLHSKEVCPAAAVLATINAQADDSVAEELKRTENPFSVLESMKGKPPTDR